MSGDGRTASATREEARKATCDCLDRPLYSNDQDYNGPSSDIEERSDCFRGKLDHLVSTPAYLMTGNGLQFVSGFFTAVTIRMDVKRL